MDGAKPCEEPTDVCRVPYLKIVAKDDVLAPAGAGRDTRICQVPSCNVLDEMPQSERALRS